ncbi:MAG: GspH/FimT family pseudopilin [Solimonas sp.]
MRGLSLLELLVTLAVAAITLGIAVPDFGRALAQHRLAVTSNALQRALTAARQTAIARNTPVTFCAGNADAGCHGQWSEGEWIVFVDEDGDGRLDDGQVPHLAERFATASDVSIAGNGPFRKAVVFREDGSAQTVTGAFAAGRLRVCAAQRLPHNASDLVLIGSGRAEMERRDYGGRCPAP